MASQTEKKRNQEKVLPKISFTDAVKNENLFTPPQSAFEALKSFENQIKRLNPRKNLNPSFKTRKGSSNSEALSAGCIMKIARTKFDNLSPSPETPICNLTSQNVINDVKRAVCLLEAAQKVSLQEFDSAEKLLGKCLVFALRSANPIQRVIVSFAEALREKIDIERNRIDLGWKLADVEESLMKFQLVILACHQKLPFTQITEFTGMQAVLDSVEFAGKVHFIDFGIKSGSHCIILMQDLANRKGNKVYSIKITAVGTSRQRLEETGKRLSSFAESLDLSFSFYIMVSEMHELREDLFELEADETMAVYSGLRLSSLLAQPNHLEYFTKFLKKLKPCVMVVTEIEANTDTDIFMDRFHEAVTLSCAMFDCVDACLKGDHVIYRKIVEEIYFKQTIRDIIVSGKEERVKRHAKIDFWRTYFDGFGIVEKELSKCSKYQADLLLKTYPCWSSCNVEMNGECMIVKWNETPILSLSVWIFKDD